MFTLLSIWLLFFSLFQDAVTNPNHVRPAQIHMVLLYLDFADKQSLCLAKKV